jgi:hypothetical protein
VRLRERACQVASFNPQRILKVVQELLFQKGRKNKNKDAFGMEKYAQQVFRENV